VTDDLCHDGAKADQVSVAREKENRHAKTPKDAPPSNYEVPKSPARR
jgi:hypothetical protein